MSRRYIERATLAELIVACEALKAATPYDPSKAAGPCCTIQVPLAVGIRLHRTWIGDYWPKPTEPGDMVGHCYGVRVEVAQEPAKVEAQLELFGAAT